MKPQAKRRNSSLSASPTPSKAQKVHVKKSSTLPRNGESGLRHSVYAVKGRRSTMEDKHSGTDSLPEYPEIGMYGVYDGHGGDYAAIYLQSHLLDQVKDDSEFPKDVSQALVKSFKRIDELLCEALRSKELKCGSTGIVAVVTPEEITVANAGDCRAILISKDGSVQVLSTEHKADVEDEQERVIQMGGKIDYDEDGDINRVDGVLAVTRAFGDVAFKPYVCADPEVMTVQRTPDHRYLVLASDGIWEDMSDEELAHLILNDKYRDGKFGAAVAEIGRTAFKRGSEDNITVIGVDVSLPDTDFADDPPPPTLSAAVEDPESGEGSQDDNDGDHDADGDGDGEDSQRKQPQRTRSIVHPPPHHPHPPVMTSPLLAPTPAPVDEDDTQNSSGSTPRRTRSSASSTRSKSK